MSDLVRDLVTGISRIFPSFPLLLNRTDKQMSVCLFGVIFLPQFPFELTFAKIVQIHTKVSQTLLVHLKR